MTDTESETTPQDNAPETVGETLRAARERHGLDRQMVADQLHLRPSIIRSIEEGDYQSVPEELFLKGYVRSYARLTEQDGDELIGRLDRELAPLRREQQRRELSPTEIIQRRKEWRRRVVGTVIGLVTIGVFGWLLWFYGGFLANETADIIEEPSEPSSDSAPAEPASQDATDASSPSSGSTAGEDRTLVEESVEAQPEPVIAEPSETRDGAEASGESAESPTATDDEPSTTDLASETAPQPVVNEQTNSATADSVALSISFSDSCWVEVVNGDGERVIVQLAEAGSEVNYEGPGPLEILLGNVNAVAGIRFRGEPVDLKDYPERSGRTQFVLGPSNGAS